MTKGYTLIPKLIESGYLDKLIAVCLKIIWVYGMVVGVGFTV